MKSSFWTLVASGCIFPLLIIGVACGGGGGSATKLRVLQASPAEGSVNVLIDGKSVSSGLLYAANTGYLSVNSGSRHLQIEPGNSNTPIVDQTINLASATQTTVIAANYSPNIAGVVLTDDITTPSSGDIALRVVNVSPVIGSADIYFVPAGSTLATVAPAVTSLAFESATPYQTLTAGTYQVFLTVPGSKTSYLSSGQIALTSGQIRTIVALNNPTGGSTSVILADLN